MPEVPPPRPRATPLLRSSPALQLPVAGSRLGTDVMRPSPGRAQWESEFITGHRPASCSSRRQGVHPRSDPKPSPAQGQTQDAGRCALHSGGIGTFPSPLGSLGTRRHPALMPKPVHDLVSKPALVVAPEGPEGQRHCLPFHCLASASCSCWLNRACPLPVGGQDWPSCDLQALWGCADPLTGDHESLWLRELRHVPHVPWHVPPEPAPTQCGHRPRHC